MEVYSRSSWFLLLFAGLTLIAVTLQENTDCPIIDQIPCTSGTKCNSNDDCENTEICCPNSCYTKRCVSKSKGIQDGDGPTESDCRPYIEKALKELEIGDVQEIHTAEDNVEDLPTIEITDDSSHQDDNDKETDIKVEDADVKSSEEGNEVVEDIDDLKKEKIQSEHQSDIDEAGDREPAINNEQVQRTNAETEPPAIIDVSVEEMQTEAHESDEIQTKVDEEVGDVSSETETDVSNKSERESVEEAIEEKLAEKEKVSKEEPTKQEIEEAPQTTDSAEKFGCPSAQEVTDANGDLCHKHRNCDENQICCADKHYRKRCVSGAVSPEVLAAESASSEESIESAQPETTTTSPDQSNLIGCPPLNKISCAEGVPCIKHKQCNENEICCPNKCYRKRCIVGTVSSAELAAEGDESEESEEKKTTAEPSGTETIPETGCPSTSAVSCTEGKLCSKHKQCDENEICCPNKCYRKRCVTGTLTSAELADEESDEEPETVETTERSKAEKIVSQSTESGCPSPKGLSCTGGEWCSKHKQCGTERICCPNKCYRKQCVTGKATSTELADEESEEIESVPETIATTKTEQIAETGCPNQNLVSCTEGELCTKHKECSESKICCPNKCYRKRCVPGVATEAELEAEQSDEVSKEVEIKIGQVEVKKADSAGCPERNEIPCDGEKCVKNKQCGDNRICCANKCYRKICIEGTIGSQEQDESSEEIQAGDTKSQEESVTVAIEDDGCPVPSKVSCTELQRCADDDDCEPNDICCPNTCYNRRCVPGQRKGEIHAKSEEEKSIEVPEALPTSKIVVKPIDVSEEVVQEPIKKSEIPSKKLEVPIPKQPEVPTPKQQEVPVPKKSEVPPPKKPSVSVKEPEQQVKIPSKPIKVLEDIYEDVKSIENDDKDLVEELSSDDIPIEKKSRDHVEELLKLDRASDKIEDVQNVIYEQTLKELKKVYETAIKPLEMLYKYRDLSNRHFGDAEIFSKPLILFMGPWSGGKSSIINYLINNEYNETALRTGAEPSPAYFNILLHGHEPEIIDGAELAADFTFSGLQKFGQGLEQRLRGIKLNAKLLEKINIVEIPGILEVRKQVSRIFPFNDACQWFIDRADIIFLVYDPAKLDVGPETEAILDQLKGREHQTRIILNKADLVRPEELLRVQGALIWNISPLMSSPQPPIMYTTSLWSKPFEPWAPTRLLHAQERAFLRDLRSAVLRRVENKIASARRFAVRVRNHAKMVDCYLTTYYNHKSVFGNRKQVANEIIEHPQNYHIYEGLSTLTNISRYDLPDPDVYKDFFKLNPLYEFQQLSATCTYFRGCPINRLDIAIAYDLPELVGRYKRNLEEAIIAANNPEPLPSPKPVKSTPRS